MPVWWFSLIAFRKSKGWFWGFMHSPKLRVGPKSRDLFIQSIENSLLNCFAKLYGEAMRLVVTFGLCKAETSSICSHQQSMHADIPTGYCWVDPTLWLYSCTWMLIHLSDLCISPLLRFRLITAIFHPFCLIWNLAWNFGLTLCSFASWFFGEVCFHLCPLFIGVHPLLIRSLSTPITFMIASNSAGLATCRCRSCKPFCSDNSVVITTLFKWF